MASKLFSGSVPQNIKTEPLILMGSIFVHQGFFFLGTAKDIKLQLIPNTDINRH